MANLLDAFEPHRTATGQPQEQGAALRIVPAQPTGTPPNTVWMGPELGYLYYTGSQPKADDLVAVVGIQGAQVVMLRETPPLRDPVIVSGCKCRCQAGVGTIFTVISNVSSQRLSHVVAFGVPDFPVQQFFGHEETFRIVGLAVDRLTPFTLYLLDDRRSLFNKVTDASPLQQVPENSYYTVVQLDLVGDTYAATASYTLANPGVPGSIIFTLDPVEDLIRNQLDPPSIYPGNPLSVIDSQLHVTMNRAPARYQRLEAGVLVTHTLTLDGDPYAKGLRGRIVQVRDRPAKRQLRYAIAWAGSDSFDDAKPGAAFEVLEFNDADEITARVTDAALISPFQLANNCNRLVVLQSDRYGRTANDLGGTALPREADEEA
jgi:hypothetical protein